MAFLLTAGQRNEMLMFEALLDAGKIKRRSRGRPRLRPAFVLADRAYSGEKAHRPVPFTHLNLPTTITA